MLSEGDDGESRRNELISSSAEESATNNNIWSFSGETKGHDCLTWLPPTTGRLPLNRFRRCCGMLRSAARFVQFVQFVLFVPFVSSGVPLLMTSFGASPRQPYGLLWRISSPQSTRNIG